MQERFAAFVSSVVPDSVTGCWYWRGSTTGNARGRFKAGGIAWLPYRFAYVALFGGHKNGLELSHLCGGGNAGNGRGSCCNPAHLLPTGKTLHKRYNPTIARVNIEVERHSKLAFAAFCERHSLPVGWCSRLPESWPDTVLEPVVPLEPQEQLIANDTAVYPTGSLHVPRRDRGRRSVIRRRLHRVPIPPGTVGPPEAVARV